MKKFKFSNTFNNCQCSLFPKQTTLYPSKPQKISIKNKISPQRMIQRLQFKSNHNGRTTMVDSVELSTPTQSEVLKQHRFTKQALPDRLNFAENCKFPRSREIFNQFKSPLIVNRFFPQTCKQIRLKDIPILECLQFSKPEIKYCQRNGFLGHRRIKTINDMSEFEKNSRMTSLSKVNIGISTDDCLQNSLHIKARHSRRQGSYLSNNYTTE